MSLGRLRICTAAALTAGLAVLAGCSGGDGDETAFTPVAGSDSAFCGRTGRGRCTSSMPAGRSTSPSPAALRTWWNAYLVAEETMLQRGAVRDP